MSPDAEAVEIAVLDDYQGVALAMADWSVLDGRARVTVFRDHIADEGALIERLRPFDVVCVMRERTPLPRAVIEGLPRLKMIASTGSRNSSIDAAAAAERGIVVTSTGYFSEPTVELTWTLIHASIRNVVAEVGSVRAGGWQRSVGGDLAGRVLGVLGLGNIGSRVAGNLVAGGENVIVAVRDRAKAQAFADKVGGKVEAMSTEDAVKKADVLILGLWFETIKEFVAANRASLVGQIIVDPSNPIALDGKGGFKKIIPVDQSSGRIISPSCFLKNPTR